MEKLEKYDVKILNAKQNMLINGGHGDKLARGFFTLYSLWKRWQRNNCPGRKCVPVSASGSVGLGNTPYQF